MGSLTSCYVILVLWPLHLLLPFLLFEVLPLSVLC
uniref:Uncharacterized protein n=1 Tax=Arundo donax TaxID=35708 RepID=A0A0A8YX32_ARUDO